MPSLGDIVNTITIRGVADGVDATTAATKGLKDAFDAASTAAKSSAGDISSAFDGIQKSIGASGAGGGGGGLSFLASIGIGAAASAAGLGTFLSWVQKTNEELSKMGAAAQSASLSLHDFQTLQFSAGTQGVSSDTFATAAAKMATNLEEASRKDNDLSKLLDANNIKLKDGNKLLIDQNGLWDVARDLISRAANEQQKIKMADIIGAGKALVPLLSESAAAFTANRSEAEKLGLVIDDDVIARAKTFDDEWRKSSLVFSTYMKAQIADLIPTIDDLISKSKEIASNVAQAGSIGAKGATPNTPDAQANDAAFNQAVVSRAAAVAAIFNSEAAGGPISVSILLWQALTGSMNENTKALIENKSAAVDDAKALNDYAAGLEGMMGKSKPFVTPVNANPSHLASDASSSSARDFWDRATDAIDKHTAKLAADTLAVGQSAAETAQLRAEFSLLEAAKQSDRDVTDEQIAKYTELRGHMTATQALQAAGINWDADEKAAFDRTTASINAKTAAYEKANIKQQISFGQQTAFFTSEDVAIANQLKGIYPVVADAMNSAEAAALRLNQGISTTSQQISGGLTTALTDVAMGTKTASQAFKDFSLIAIRAIEQMIIQLTIVGPLMRGLQGGLTSIFPSLFPAAASSPLMSVSGGAGQGFMVPTASGGGMVETLSGRAWVHPAYFENAPRFDTGGMITDGGVPIVAHPGERVLNRQQTAAYNSGAGGQTIHMGDTYVDARGSQMTEGQFRAIIAQNNKEMLATLPDRVAAINRDPRKRG